jgi:hypothetical protein
MVVGAVLPPESLIVPVKAPFASTATVIVPLTA